MEFFVFQRDKENLISTKKKTKDRDEPNNGYSMLNLQYKLFLTTDSGKGWHTNLEQMPLNRCQQLPAPYKRLIHD